jgi:hypothetical protein
MQFTDKQLAQLRLQRELREHPPTLAWFLRRNGRIYLLMVVLGAATTGFFAWAGWVPAATFFAGFVSATLVRDLKWFRQFVRGWPLSHAITDWERVDALLDEHASRSYHATHKAASRPGSP